MIRLFLESVTPIQAQLDKLGEMNKKLRTTRDLLLPRLMSGEIARVAMRVRQGGHNIPSDVIRRRFVAGRKNFDDVYRSLVDFWQRFDNSGPTPQLLEEGENP